MTTITYADFSCSPARLVRSHGCSQTRGWMAAGFLFASVGLAVALGGWNDYSKERLRTAAINDVFYEGRIGMVITKPSGEVVEINNELARMSGYTSAEVQGHRVGMLMPPVEQTRHVEKFDKWIASGTPDLDHDFACNLLRKDGGLHPVRIRVRVIRRLGLYYALVFDRAEESHVH